MKTRFLLISLVAFALVPAALAAPKPVVLAVDRPETQTAGTFTLTSRDFQQGGEIPVRFTLFGDGLSPSLAWEGLPEGTRSLAVMMEDPDAPSGRPFVHWLAWNLDPAAGRIDRGGVTLGAKLGRNGRGHPSYVGPLSSSREAHRYHFQMFALDTDLALKAGSSREQLLAAMKGHVLAKADLVGTFVKTKGR